MKLSKVEKKEIIEAISKNIAESLQNFILCNIKELIRQENLPAITNNGETMCFDDLIKLKIESSVSENTRRGYAGFRRYFLRRYGSGPLLSEVNQRFTNLFVCNAMEDYKDAPATLHLIISRYNALINLGRSEGYISSLFRFVYPRHGFVSADHNLTFDELSHIFDAFQIAFSKDTLVRKPVTRALGIFILDIALQGLAPVDMSLLKIKSLRFGVETLGDGTEIKVLSVNTLRKKTGNPVSIVTSLRGIGDFVKALTAGKSEDDYLIPCFDPEKSYTDGQRQNRLSNYFNRTSAFLNKAMKAYYKEMGLGEPRRISYYFARHAFCNLVDSLDIPRHLIQHMVGHRSTVLEKSYLRAISVKEQAEISDRMLSQFFRGGTNQT